MTSRELYGSQVTWQHPLTVDPETVRNTPSAWIEAIPPAYRLPTQTKSLCAKVNTRGYNGKRAEPTVGYFRLQPAWKRIERPKRVSFRVWTDEEPAQQT